MFKTSSNLESVSSDIFSFPFKILEIYCWVQFMRSAEIFCVRPMRFICNRTLTAIFWEWRNQEQFSRLHSASSYHIDGVLLWCVSRNERVFCFIMGVIYSISDIKSIKPSASIAPPSRRKLRTVSFFLSSARVCSLPFIVGVNLIAPPPPTSDDVTSWFQFDSLNAKPRCMTRTILDSSFLLTQ